MNIVNELEDAIKHFYNKAVSEESPILKAFNMGKASGCQNILVAIKSHDSPITCIDIGVLANAASKVKIEEDNTYRWLAGLKEVYSKVFEYLMSSPIHKYMMYFYDTHGSYVDTVYYDDISEVNKAYVKAFNFGKNLYNLPTVWEYSKGEYVRKPGY